MASYAAYCFLLVIAVFAVCCSAHGNHTNCTSQTLPEGRTFEKCIDLKRLGAILHWTYAAASGNLSIGFTAPNSEGWWVAWGINPTSYGMAGAQALISKPRINGTAIVDTYNMSGKSMASIVQGNISIGIDRSLLTTETSDNVSMIFATLLLEPNTMTINTTWQVGPMVSGEAKIHAFEFDNLNSYNVNMNLTGDGSSEPMKPPGGNIATSPGDTSAPPSAGNMNKLGNWNLGAALTSFVFLWLCRLGI